MHSRPIKARKFRYLLLVTVSVVAVSAAEPARAESWWVEGGYNYQWLSGTRYPVVNQLVNGGMFFVGSTVRPRTAHVFTGAFGYRTNSPWDFRFAYSGLRSRPRNTAAGGAVSANGPWQSSPFTGTFSTSITFASIQAQVRSRYDIGDFDVGYNVGLGAGNLRIFGGLRVARFRASLTARLAAVSNGYGLNITDDERKYRFVGAGPHIGFSGEMPMGALGPFTISVVGSGSFAYLFGTTRAETLTTLCTEFNGCASRSFSDKSGRSAYSLDGNLGVGLGFLLAGLPSTFVAGYRTEYFHGVVNTLTGPFSLGAGAGTTRGNLFGHGPYAILKIRFGPP